MISVKYIGMDVHLATISIVALYAAWKLVMEVTIATKAAAILDFIRGVSGTLHVTLEEGTYADWLYDLLLPEVAEVGIYDYAGPHRKLALSLPVRVAFRLAKDVGALIARSRSSIPRPPILLLTLRLAPRDAQRKTRGRVDRHSFLVRLFHPLLQSGLSRRTGYPLKNPRHSCPNRHSRLRGNDGARTTPWRLRYGQVAFSIRIASSRGNSF